VATSSSPCPFCPGRETETPPEIVAYRTNGQPPNNPEWLVRVIPDRAPLLHIEGDIQRVALGLFDHMSGRGASELVIEHPAHGSTWDALPVEAVERVLWMYRERIVDLYRDVQIRAVLIWRTERPPEDPWCHPVSRILGAPIIFDDLRVELAAARRYFAYKQRCLFCDILRQERQEGIRVVQESPGFQVYTPYGSRRPFETWVVPTLHGHGFESISPEEMADLARCLQTVFRRLRTVHPGVPVEFTLHTAPNAPMWLQEDERRSLPEDYHWHIELAPSGGPPETVGGFAVNRVPPEAAAQRLREALTA
jgi:UDPglucose--hexose-1-phosphate uridylyltransferase